MSDVIQNLNRAIDHLDTLETLFGTIQRRINEGNVTPEWLSGVAGLIKGNSMAANKIIGDECCVANGYTREFIAQLDQGISRAMDGPSAMQVQSQDGNVVHIGHSQITKNTGGECA